MIVSKRSFQLYRRTLGAASSVCAHNKSQQNQAASPKVQKTRMTNESRRLRQIYFTQEQVNRLSYFLGVKFSPEKGLGAVLNSESKNCVKKEVSHLLQQFLRGSLSHVQTAGLLDACLQAHKPHGWEVWRAPMRSRYIAFEKFVNKFKSVCMKQVMLENNHMNHHKTQEHTEELADNKRLDLGRWYKRSFILETDPLSPSDDTATYSSFYKQFPLSSDSLSASDYPQDDPHDDAEYQSEEACISA